MLTHLSRLDVNHQQTSFLCFSAILTVDFTQRISGALHNWSFVSLCITSSQWIYGYVFVLKVASTVRNWKPEAWSYSTALREYYSWVVINSCLITILCDLVNWILGEWLIRFTRSLILHHVQLPHGHYAITYSVTIIYCNKRIGNLYGSCNRNLVDGKMLPLNQTWIVHREVTE